LAASQPQPELVGGDVEKIKSVVPKERRLVELDHLGGDYVPPAAPQNRRLIEVTMDVELSHDEPIQFLTDTVRKWLREQAVREGWPYKTINETISVNPGRIATFTVSAAGEQRASGDSRGAGGAGSAGSRTGGSAPPRQPPGPPRTGGMKPPGPGG